MNTLLTTKSPSTPAKKPCNCGCSECHGECCDLDCLVKPRFFCGQLLTDADLSVLLDWVKDKTALSRYRHGWGIACGLQVHASTKTGKESQVSIRPGYAVDCCGNDIVICDEATYDLAKFCKPVLDQCSDTQQAPPTQKDGSVTFGGFTIPSSQVLVVDLSVFYKETLSDSQTSLSRGSCNGTQACEFTRTHESYSICPTLVTGACDDTAGAAAVGWYRDYRKGLNALFDEIKRRWTKTDANKSVLDLLTWLDSYPLHDFCFIRDWLYDLSRSDAPPPADWFPKAIFWIVQDWRNQHLHCECFACGPDTGVPLARVWLRRYKDRCGKDACKVLYVNSYAPFRRAMQTECWPCEPGCINLGRFVWERLEFACVEMAHMGIPEISPRPFVPDEFDSMREQLTNDQMFIECIDQRQGKKLVVYFYPDNCNDSRIVCFGLEDRASEVAIDPATLPADHPDLDLRLVNGIADATARRLNTAGIHNLRDLAASTPEAVADALKATPINPPSVKRSQVYIDDAKAALEKLKNPARV